MPGGGVRWRFLRELMRVLLVLVVGLTSCHALVAQCPQDTTGVSDSYCKCVQNKVRSGILVSIKCDFRKREDVELTEALYPLWRTAAVNVYVQIANATSVKVSEAFMGAWLKIPSSGLDLWNCGTVTFDSAPPPHAPRIPTFSTFAGIGMVGCKVKELPTRLLRDRNIASLVIKNSIVGVIQPGLLHNVVKLRYLVIENSEVGSVEGSLSSNGNISLGMTHPEVWNGLLLSNVTIDSLAAGAFSFTKRAFRNDKLAKVEVIGCRVGKVNTGAFTMTGDMEVTIKRNYFTNLAPQAFKIDVTSDMKFVENVAVRANPRSLESIVCQNFTSLEKNTVHLDTPSDLGSSSIITFHSNCGMPQIFQVVSSSEPLVMQVASVSTWVLLAILLLVLLGTGVAALLNWRNNNRRREFTRDDSFHFHNGLTSTDTTSTSTTQPAEPEVTTMEEITGEGVSNPLYEDMEYKSSL